MRNLFYKFVRMARPNGKIDFILSLNPDLKILDVGCGNNSPYIVKSILPKCHYTGVDIQEYNLTKPNLSDNYILTTADLFSYSINKLEAKFDAVISSHNLEHCKDWESTLSAMISCLVPGGKIYIAFPSTESQYFPSRHGTLNYFDDNTHILNPPDFDLILKILTNSDCEVIFREKRYSPILFFLLGMILEPFSLFTKKVLKGTWEYYGFESILIARKKIR